MRLQSLDQPVLFALVITLIVISFQWLLYLGASAIKQGDMAKFVSGPGH